MNDKAISLETNLLQILNSLVTQMMQTYALIMWERTYKIYRVFFCQYKHVCWDRRKFKVLGRNWQRVKAHRFSSFSWKEVRICIKTCCLCLHSSHSLLSRMQLCFYSLSCYGINFCKPLFPLPPIFDISSCVHISFLSPFHCNRISFTIYYFSVLF